MLRTYSLLLVLTLCCIAIPTVAIGEQESSWPCIVGLEKEYHFDNASEAAIELDILGVDGEGKYRLECHNYLYEEDQCFDYSGEFECRLVSLYSAEKYSNLLTENPEQSADWDSRARFFSNEVVGECAEFPDYGKKRSFRLRGMLLSLEIKDVILHSKNIMKNSTDYLLLKSFRFLINIRPDPDATSLIAEKTTNKRPSSPDCNN